MTQAQVNYLSHLEDVRHNKAMEAVDQQKADAASTTAAARTAETAHGIGKTIASIATAGAAAAGAGTAAKRAATAKASTTGLGGSLFTPALAVKAAAVKTLTPQEKKRMLKNPIAAGIKKIFGGKKHEE